MVIGVDEHVWRHTRRGDKYVTVIIDLTPVQNKTGPARLLDMVDGRSKRAFKTWLAERPRSWRDTVEVVAMDGFTGYKTATTEEVPDDGETITVLELFPTASGNEVLVENHAGTRRFRLSVRELLASGRSNDQNLWMSLGEGA